MSAQELKIKAPLARIGPAPTEPATVNATANASAWWKQALLRRRRAPYWLRSAAAAFAFAASAAMLVVAPGVAVFMANRDQIPSQWDPFDPLDLRAPATLVQAWKIGAARNDGALCRAAVATAAVGARPLPDKVRDQYCRQVDTVSLRRLESARLAPVRTRCGVAMALYLWEKETVQPAAARFFGEPVAEILHFGSYSCRRIAGTAMWSQHATANALDVAGFRLKSGRVVSVLTDWSGDVDAAGFLRAVRSGACDQFTVVLSPDYNAAHRDHFHFDLGRWPVCR